MQTAALADWIASVLVLGLRIAPVFAFAPPFSLIRMPVLFRVLFGLGLCAALLAAHPGLAMVSASHLSSLFLAAVHELALGSMLVLVFQLAFGALYLAGRTIDIQAGFGLAVLIDPATSQQVPLVGTLFAYAAGAVFFAMDGHIELLRFLAATLDAVPLGNWAIPHAVGRITAFMALTTLTAFGVAGAAIAALFLVDMAIAILSRTVPQMNVLVLGLQVKTLVLLFALPLSFSVGGALILRLMTMTLEALPRLI